MTDTTLVILNPHANNGRVRQVWGTLKPELVLCFGAVDGQFTETPAATLPLIQAAYAEGVRRVLSVGGDGTNHSVINAILTVQAANPGGERIAYGNIPVGTGRDWTRAIGAPLQPQAAIRHLAQTTPQPIDVGEFQVDDAPPEFFLNTSSIGLGGCVSRSVNNLGRRYPWSFMWQTLRCIFRYDPQTVTVTVDDQQLFEGRTFITVVTNGGVFGHGMKIAPPAKIDDGKLDVVAIETLARHALLRLFAQVYSGTHLNHPLVMHRRATEVTITSHDGVLAVELDGETRNGRTLRYRVHPAGLTILR